MRDSRIGMMRVSRAGRYDEGQLNRYDEGQEKRYDEKHRQALIAAAHAQFNRFAQSARPGHTQ